MSVATISENWSSANQRWLMSEVAALGRLLRGESNDEAILNEARTAMPAPPALDALCAMFGLSDFERRVLLLCAAVELDGHFASSCSAAPGSGGNTWPSFGLALATFPDAHWDALANSAPLRRWRLIELCGDGPLATSRLRI